MQSVRVAPSSECRSFKSECSRSKSRWVVKTQGVVVVVVVVVRVRERGPCSRSPAFAIERQRRGMQVCMVHQARRVKQYVVRVQSLDRCSRVAFVWRLWCSISFCVSFCISFCINSSIKSTPVSTPVSNQLLYRLERDSLKAPAVSDAELTSRCNLTQPQGPSVCCASSHHRRGSRSVSAASVTLVCLCFLVGIGRVFAQGCSRLFKAVQARVRVSSS